MLVTEFTEKQLHLIMHWTNGLYRTVGYQANGLRL